MSLIGEALKKAHLEAIRQDSSRGGLVHTPGVAQYRQPQARDKRTWTTTLIVSNVLFALLVAAIVMWMTTGEDPHAATAAVSPPAELAAAPTSPPGNATSDPGVTSPVTASDSVATTSSSAAVPAAAVPAATSHGDSASAGRTAGDLTPPVRETFTAPVETSSIPPPAQETGAPPPARQTLSTVDGLVSGQTYMNSVPVPGGADLVLSGMSVSGGRGVALINSRMVREGDRVGPFLVGSIADRRVALEYKGITVYLKMP